MEYKIYQSETWGAYIAKEPRKPNDIIIEDITRDVYITLALINRIADSGASLPYVITDTIKEKFNSRNMNSPKGA